jgi:uncharacterized protein YuzB (UPF0349 family)
MAAKTIKKELGLYVSSQNSKLGRTIPTVNFPPIVYCNPNAPCTKKGCYACKGRMSCPNVRKTMEQNRKLWEKDPNEFFQQLEGYLQYYPTNFFRWFSSGDIPSEDFLRRMCLLADNHVITKFLCFTKKFDIVDGYLKSGNTIPINLTIIYSCWDTFIPENPYNFPMAYVKFKEMESKIPENAFKCSKFCGKCVFGEKNCWALKHGEAVVFDKH